MNCYCVLQQTEMKRLNDGCDFPAPFIPRSRHAMSVADSFACVCLRDPSVRRSIGMEWKKIKIYLLPTYVSLLLPYLPTYVSLLLSFLPTYVSLLLPFLPMSHSFYPTFQPMSYSLFGLLLQFFSLFIQESVELFFMLMYIPILLSTFSSFRPLAVAGFEPTTLQ